MHSGEIRPLTDLIDGLDPEILLMLYGCSVLLS